MCADYDYSMCAFPIIYMYLSNSTEIHNYILFSIYSELRKISLDISHSVDEHVDIDGIKNIVSVTVDPLIEDIFWSDTGRYKIVRHSHTTGRIIEIPQLGSTQPHGLALDWISQQVYWTDVNSRSVEVSDYNGEVRVMLLTREDGLSGPRALNLDLKNK